MDSVFVVVVVVFGGRGGTKGVFGSIVINYHDHQPPTHQHPLKHALIQITQTQTQIPF